MAGPALLFALVVALYAPSMRFGFLYDDYVLIVDAPAPRTVGDIFSVFAERHWHNLPYYRPVSRLTMVVQKALYGDNAGPYHFFNATVLGVIAVLFYAILRCPAFAIHRGPALVFAALFAAHPIASACVYPICSGRETLLPGLFTLAAVLAYLHAGRGAYALALVFFAAAMLCKEQGVMVLSLFVWADLTGVSADPPGRSVRRWVARTLPPVLVVAGYFVIRWSLFGGEGAHRLAVLKNPALPALSLLYTLQTIFVPFIEVIYEPRIEVWMSYLRLGVVFAFVAPFAAIAIRQRAAVGRAVLFWLGWFLLVLLPTANLLRQQAAFAERYGFLSLAALVAMLAILVASTAMPRRLLPWMAALGVLLIAPCAAISFHRGAAFRTERAFLDQWLSTDLRSAQAYAAFGDHFRRRDDFERAEQNYRVAVDLDPHGAATRNSLAILLQGRGREDEAEKYFLAAIRADPQFIQAHYNLGVLLLRTGELSKAAALLERALALDPQLAEAHNNLGVTRERQGALARAAAHYRRALALRSDYHLAEVNLQRVERRLGTGD